MSRFSFRYKIAVLFKTNRTAEARRIDLCLTKQWQHQLKIGLLLYRFYKIIEICLSLTPRQILLATAPYSFELEKTVFASVLRLLMSWDVTNSRHVPLFWIGF